MICETEGCEAPLGKGPRKTNLCKPCSCRRNARNPERRRKCSEAMARKVAEPGFREAHSKRMIEAFAEARVRNPNFTEEKRAHARRVGLAQAGMASPKMAKGSEGRARSGFKTSERHMGWCPFEYREEYRRLVYSKKLKKAEAKSIIRQQIAVDTKKYHKTGNLQASFRSPQPTAIASIGAATENGGVT